MINIRTINGKLVLAFTGLACMVLLVSGFSLTSLIQANDRFNSYLTETNARAVLVAKLQQAVDLRAIGARNLLLLESVGDRSTEAERVNSAQRDVARYLDQLQYNVDHSNEITATAAELIAKIQRLESLYGPVAQKIVALALAE
jgi:methyl-accepting chemotaxis protein-1 (serine sensor receptor)